MSKQMMKSEMIGLGPLKDYIKMFGERGEVEYRREVKTTSLRTKNDYRRGVKGHSDTGKLYNSIAADSDSNWETAEIGSTEKYAVFLEVGTKAHPINVKNAKFLAFFWEKTGTMVFLKKVQHPGTAAHPYLLMSFTKNTAGFSGRIKARLDKIQ